MTLRVRFALWAAALFLVLLLLFGAFVYLRMQQVLNAELDDWLQLSASQIVTMVGVHDGQVKLETSQPQTDQGAAFGPRRGSVRILDATGQVIQAYGRYEELPVAAGSLAAAQKGKPSLLTVSDPQSDRPVRVYSAPILEDGRLIGIVQVARSHDSVHETLDRLLSALLLAVPLSVLAAALGGYWLSARALAPIDRITRTARRISAESLSSRIGLPATNDEVGRLAMTFDEMLARLDGAFQREHQFTADASHELRTPLDAMQAILSVTGEKQRTPEEYELAMADLAEETDRLRALVENLLQAARGETSQIGTQDAVDLTTLLRDVTDSLRPLAAAKGLTLISQVPDGLTLQGDSDSLIRLFVNLVDNAVKYTEKGGVTLTAWSDRGWMRIAVADSGTGIPSAHLSHIFDRFYRVEQSRSGNGAGLGLAIALDITRAHGGTLQVDNAPGGGAIFTVSLPKKNNAVS